MNQKKNNTIATVVVLLFGFILFYVGTDGFTAFTEETARTNRLIEEQPKFPDVTLEDSKERNYTMDEFQGKYVMLTFIYTACTTVCPQLEMNLSEVYQKVPSQFIGEDIVFLSISFDPTRDDPETLDRYRTYFNSDGETWRMARINDQEELETLLSEFGVVVIPNGEGDFTHNSAFYLVDREGYLVDVMDYTDVQGAADKVTTILNEEVEG